MNEEIIIFLNDESHTIILILELCALQFWLESSNLEIFSFVITDKQERNIFFYLRVYI